jgi:hypothetical protein
MDEYYMLEWLARIRAQETQAVAARARLAVCRRAVRPPRPRWRGGALMQWGTWLFGWLPTATGQEDPLNRRCPMPARW